MVLLKVQGLSGPICKVHCDEKWVGRQVKVAIETATCGDWLACDQQLAIGSRIIGDEDFLGESAQEESIVSVIHVPPASLSAAICRQAAKRRWKGFKLDAFEQLLAEKRGLDRIGHESEHWSEEDTARWHFWNFTTLFHHRPNARFKVEVQRLEEKHRRVFGHDLAVHCLPSHESHESQAGSASQGSAARLNLLNILFANDVFALAHLPALSLDDWAHLHNVREKLGKLAPLLSGVLEDVFIGHLVREFQDMLGPVCSSRTISPDSSRPASARSSCSSSDANL